ncbi:MAG: protein kinase domain-containing protein, partial [Gemmataceae bacterium]
MAVLYRCLQGHAWEAQREATLDGGCDCPYCGTASVPVDASDLDESAPWPALPPASSGPTVVRPALQSPPRTHAEAPVSPSALIGDRLPQTIEIPSTSSSVPAAVAHNPEWPVVPGYELLAELGRGGMGVVYKARQVALNRVVALKMILSGTQANARERARFHHEAQAVARLQHPNIVQIFDIGEQGGHAYFSLEFVDGGSLADQLKPEPCPVNDAAGLIEVLARGVHFAHQAGIVHRDLKPANILLGRRKNDSSKGDSQTHEVVTPGWGMLVPKIADFGLAKTLDDDGVNTRSGMVVGTPGYMAPEQAAGKQDTGAGADVWALGVILYQLVTGRMPFEGETPMDVMIKITQTDPVPPTRRVPRLPRDLETIVLKCLEKSPAVRYPAAADLADDLRRFLNHEPIKARPVRSFEHAARWLRRRPATAGLLAFAAAALVTLGVGYGSSVRADQARRSRAGQEVEATLAKARQAADRGEWEDVRGLLARPRAAMAQDELLATFRDRLLPLAAEADEQIARRQRARAFAPARDDALFHATLAADAPAQRERSRQKIRRALAAVDGHHDEDRPSCFELLLALAELEDRPADALAALDRAAALDIRTHAYHLRRARYLRQAGDESAAKVEEESARRLPPTTDVDHYFVGIDAYRQGRTAAAEASFSEVLRRRPDHFWARYFLALCQVRLGDDRLSAAEANLSGCLGQQPDVVWIYLLRGFVEAQLGRYAEADRDFERALALLEKSPDANASYVLYNNRAVAHLARKRFADARADLQRAVAAQPNQYQAHVSLSHVALAQGDRDLALASLTRAIDCAAGLHARKELDGRTLQALYRQRFLLHSREGRSGPGLADCDRAIALGGDDAALAALWRDRGHLCRKAKNPADARASYEQALKRSPRDADVWRWHGETCLELRDYPAADDSLTRYHGCGGKPDLAVARARGLARAMREDHQGALGDFTVALALAPDDAVLRLYRGRTYLACHAWELAERDFDRVIAADPKNAGAYHARGLARAQQRRGEAALEDADRAAALAGADARQLVGLAALFAQVA